MKDSIESKPKTSAEAPQTNQQLGGLPKDLQKEPLHQPAASVKELLSRAEFAKALGVCSHTIQRMERRGVIRGLRFNSRLIRYPVSELARLIAEASV